MEKVKRTPAKLPELVAEFNMEVLNKAPLNASGVFFCVSKCPKPRFEGC